MTSGRHIRLLIDAREFVHGKFTGIARVLQGLTKSLADSIFCKQISLAVHDLSAVPSGLKLLAKVSLNEIPKSFLKSEKAISDLSPYFDLYISPYPKLPFFGIQCHVIHIIHDVLDLTHSLYARRLKVIFDKYRLKKAMYRADITWYDSSWSMSETLKHFGFSGRNPKVRYPGIEKAFSPEKQKEERIILETFGLKAGYILSLGNGMPHKNLGVLLEIAGQLDRRIVFVGVSDRNRQYWQSHHPGVLAAWIGHVDEEYLPALLKGSFCLVHPSLVEGYGYPPLEAMACGRPAIISRIPVLIETTGNCALVASPNEPDAWIKALNALENPSNYQEFVEKGLRWTEPLRGHKAWEPYLSDIDDLMKGN